MRQSALSIESRTRSVRAVRAGPGPEPVPAAGWAAPGGPCRAEALSRRRHELALTLVVAVLLTPAALLLAPLAWLWRALRPAFAV